MFKLRYLIPVIVIAIGIYAAYRVNSKPYEVLVDITQVPTFSEVTLDFTHEYKRDRSLPFMGSAIIDINNDNKPEVFLGGGALQRDGLFKFTGSGFEDISGETGLSKEPGDATYGAASIDVNKDGFADLFVARSSGVYLYLNKGGFFIGGRLPIKFDPTTVPLAIAAGDINRDGHVDLFISCFLKIKHLRPQIFNDPNYGAQSMLLLNKGDNTFIDITADAGLEYTHNAFTAVFADLDNDDWLDLIVAYNTAHVRTYKNLGNNSFQNIPNPTHDYFGYPLGIAAGDFNNDGNVDLFFTGIGSTIPEFLARGDLHENQPLNKKWVLLKNEGDFKFTDVADEYLLADYELGWGAVFADFNLDGLDDLVVAGNYINFAPQWLYRNPGKFFIQKDNSTFAAVERTAGVQNREFSISPLVADFNNDGYPDLVLANIAGSSKAYINHGGNAKYLKVDLGDTPAAIGAKLSILPRGDDKYIVKQVISQQGLAADQTHIVTFGLGQHSGIDALHIDYPSGKTLTLENPAVNSTIDLQLKPQTPLPDVAAQLPVILNQPGIVTKATGNPQPEAPNLDKKESGMAQPTAKPAQTKSDEPTIEDELQRLLSN